MVAVSDFEKVLIRHPLIKDALKDDDYNGAVPLHAACQASAPLIMLKFLVVAYPEALLIPNNDGDLPLHVAVRSASPLETIRWLLSEMSDRMNVGDGLKTPNLFGDLPLFLAFQAGAPSETIQFLMEESVAVLDASDKEEVLLKMHWHIIYATLDGDVLDRWAELCGHHVLYQAYFVRPESSAISAHWGRHLQRSGLLPNEFQLEDRNYENPSWKLETMAAQNGPNSLVELLIPHRASFVEQSLAEGDMDEID